MSIGRLDFALDLVLLELGFLLEFSVHSDLPSEVLFDIPFGLVLLELLFEFEFELSFDFALQELPFEFGVP